MKRVTLGILLVLASLALARGVIQVAYAGSMGVVMDHFVGPAFANTQEVQYQGIGQGAYALAQLIKARQLNPDIFISVTPGPMELLIKDGLVQSAYPIASTQMVIAYSPKSRFAPLLKEAAEGKRRWYRVLETPGLRFGRTNPATDPQGRNILFTFLLAERYYHQPDLMQKILRGYANPTQIFAEPSLLLRLESGQIDASSAYLSAVTSYNLPYIKLPSQVNLSDPRYAKSWYRGVHLELPSPSGSGKALLLYPRPLVFYAAVLRNTRHPKLARAFVTLLLSSEGQTMLRENGYGPPLGASIP